MAICQGFRNKSLRIWKIFGGETPGGNRCFREEILRLCSGGQIYSISLDNMRKSVSIYLKISLIDGFLPVMEFSEKKEEKCENSFSSEIRPLHFDLRLRLADKFTFM